MPVLIVLLVAYIFSQFYRSCLAVISADLARDLALGPAELGHLTAIWFLTFSLSQFGIGYLLDKHGPRRTCSGLMLAAVAGAALFSQATSYAMALTGVGLIGLGCAPILMSALYYFGRTAPPERFPFYISIMVGIGNLGNLLGARPLAQAVELIGWRGSMLAIALMTLASAVSVFFIVTDPARVESPDRGGNAWTELKDIMSLKVIWPLFLLDFVSYAMIAAERGLWIGPFLEQVHGLGPLERGNAAFVMALGMAIGALVASSMVGVMGTLKRVVILGTAGTIASFAAIGGLSWLSTWATVVLLFMAGLFGMGYGIIMSHARLFFPEHLLGRGVTFVNFLSMAGAGTALSLSGMFVRGAQADGVPAATLFSQMHLSFAAILTVALVWYLRVPNAPAKRGD